MKILEYRKDLIVFLYVVKENKKNKNNKNKRSQRRISSILFD